MVFGTCVPSFEEASTVLDFGYFVKRNSISTMFAIKSREQLMDPTMLSLLGNTNQDS